MKLTPREALGIILGIAEARADGSAARSYYDWVRVKTICEDVFNSNREIDAESGPENSREEVVGISTRGKSANLGNSGFSGGSTGRLVAA